MKFPTMLQARKLSANPAATSSPSSNPSAGSWLRPTAEILSQGGADIILIAEHEGVYLQRALADLHVTIKLVGSAEEARRVVSSQTIALIVRTPMPERRAEQTLEVLATQSSPARKLPVFFIVNSEFEDSRARELYDAGAAAVVEWPTEVLILPHLMTELLGVTLADNESAPVDAALSEAVNARIESDSSLGGSVQCFVVGAVAAIRGTVDSLWKRRRLVSMIESVPGIAAITDTQLRIEAPKVDDAQLHQNLLDILTSTATLEPDTLSLAVDSGQVTVVGVVGSRAEFRKLELMIENTEGVISVKNLVTISAKAKAVGHATAQDLQATIDRQFPQARVRVNVFGKTVVLTGTVDTIAIRTKLSDTVEDHANIDRIVNKIQISA